MVKHLVFGQPTCRSDFFYHTFFKGLTEKLGIVLYFFKRFGTSITNFPTHHTSKNDTYRMTTITNYKISGVTCMYEANMFVKQHIFQSYKSLGVLDKLDKFVNKVPIKR